MLRNFQIAWIFLLFAPVAHSQSDNEILEVVRANAVKIYLEQATWTMSETFHKSGLAPSDKEKLIQQWAKASAECAVDALVRYAEFAGVPLSEMVGDSGDFVLLGDGSSADFQISLESCIELASAAVGASLP